MQPDITAGILAGLKNISPNIKGSAEGNTLKLHIPKEDIIAQIFKGANPAIANAMKVNLTEKGIDIEIRIF
jgi:hypothetical protein